MKWPLLPLLAFIASCIAGCSTVNSLPRDCLSISIITLNISEARLEPSSDVGWCSVDVKLENVFDRNSTIDPLAVLQSVYDGRYEDTNGVRWELSPWYLRPGYFVDYPKSTLSLGPHETKDMRLKIHYYRRPLSPVNGALFAETNKVSVPTQVKYQISFHVVDPDFGVKVPTKIVGQGVLYTR